MSQPHETRNSKSENRSRRAGGERSASFEFRASLWLVLLAALLAPADSRAQEVVVNLSAGRVIVCVAKGGMVIATVEKRLEAESRPPVLAELSGKRVAVLMGATEWISPAGEPTVRMERELPLVVRALTGPGPQLGDGKASDLEGVGLAMLEPLRQTAQRLVQKVDIQRDEPLLEVVLIGYVENYGPEMWVLDYRIVQEPLRSEYWQTRVLRPRYVQLYPPEKGQPRTLMEARYPVAREGEAEPGMTEPLLLDLLRRNDPRLAGLRNADKLTSEAAVKILEGESHKAPLEGVVTLLRGALEATLGADEELSFSVIEEQKGFTWIVPQRLPAERADERKERTAGAPTLRKPPQ